ncbi:MAG: flippase-like domain-containing protein [Bacteroidales bacterium]|nr:flippase-like domain-containing protein [Bacteroidales bacterium]
MKSSSFYRIFLIIGIITVIIVIFNIGITSIYENILKTGWWFFAIIGIWAVVYLINTFSWHLIVRDNEKNFKRVTFWQLYKITVSGFAINYITPVAALGGEPYRIMELKKYVGVHKATSSVILFSMMHIASHFLFWLVSTILLYLVFDPSPGVFWLMLITALFCLVALYYFFKGYRYGLVAKTFRFFGKLPWVGKKIRNFNEKHHEDFIKIDQQIAQLHSGRKTAFYGALMSEFTARVVGCLEIYFIAFAIGQQITFLESVILVAVSSLFANIMFFSPLQLGTREGGFWLATKGIAIDTELGLYISLITRIRETCWIIVGLLLMKKR